MTEPRQHDYHVTFVLTYYRPYVSGLSEAARLVAEGLASRGWNVAVACTQHDPRLPLFEVQSGVSIHRSPVQATIGKGAISLLFVPLVRRLASRSQLLNLHLPLLEAGPITALVKAPIVLTYQCDVVLGRSFRDRAIVQTMDGSSRLALRRAEAVVFSSMDYAQASRLAQSPRKATYAIRPPYVDRTGGSPTYRETSGTHIGFLGRIVAEKGLDILIEAFSGIEADDARLLIGGDFTSVAGGSILPDLEQALELDHRIRLLGFVPNQRVPDFLASLDVLALPSVNSLEAYGIVQLEAMTAGVNVIASDLPGVRVPVRTYGGGALVRPGDALALKHTIQETSLWSRPIDQARLNELLRADDPVDCYEEVFTNLIRGKASPSQANPERSA
jgi:glycosyltransferase involved in cell wall biosynthesis